MAAERGTALVFLASGLIQASWMSRLPAVQDRLDVGVAGLGMALGSLGAGTVIGMLIGGPLCRKHTTAAVIRVGSSIGAAILVGATVMTQPLLFGLLLFAFGVATGAWDAAMNIRGIALERLAGRKLMSSLHGWWSLGTVVGAVSGVLAIGHNLPVAVQCVLVAIAVAVLCHLGTRGPLDHRELSMNGRFRVSRRFGLLAALILVGALIEGTANDWLTILLTQLQGFSHVDAARVYTLFVVTMTVGRFGGLLIHRRLGGAATLALGAAIACLGAITTVVVHHSLVTYLAVACWALGVCVIFPAAISACGAESASTIAVLTTVGYGAGLLGPIAIGSAGAMIGLDRAILAGVVGGMILVCSLAAATGDLSANGRRVSAWWRNTPLRADRRRGHDDVSTEVGEGLRNGGSDVEVVPEHAPSGAVQPPGLEESHAQFG
jgi:fucose permease